jgi:hypothetical protein|nr:MAG TPA: hypothetical protein [Caudoviricetes sp.]
MSKSAKEMFEELGFKRVETPYKECICYEDKHIYHIRQIIFWIDNKIMCNNLYYDYFQMQGSLRINKNLLKAINKQVEELGWLDE